MIAKALCAAEGCVSPGDIPSGETRLRHPFIGSAKVGDISILFH